MNFRLDGQVAVLTGGAGVLCTAIAKALAQQGAKIALLDLFEDRATAAAEQLRAEGFDAMGCRVDVLSRESIAEAAERVLEQYGRVDILVNGAGGNKPAATTGPQNPFFDMPEDALKWVFDLNLMGTIMPSQVFGKHMAEQKAGCIVNISSMAAFTPLTKTVAYSAAKAAISNFTQWLAVHFNQEYSKEIRVNAIAPGFLLTEQNRYLLTDGQGGMTERGRQIISGTPMARYGDPQELCGAVVFFCSQEASFINGVVLPIDGGFSAFSGV